MTLDLPSSARVVIVGGGIAGCSVAYHLAKAGWDDVLLLEQGRISCGTTWHAAGLVAQLRATHTQTKLARYTKGLIERLEAETGQATGFRQTGSISVARTPAREEELKRQAAMAAAFDVEVSRIGLEEAKARIPTLNTADLVAAYWLPGDGTTNPTDTTMALAKGARAAGARIMEGVRVDDVVVTRGAVAGVRLGDHRIAAERVVLCCGMWTRALADRIGVAVPLHAAEHMYLVTRPIEGILRGQPVLRDMDGYIYIKEEVGGLLLGGFEPTAKPWGHDGIPDGFEFQQLPEDWDQFQVFLDNGIRRIPALGEAQVRQLLVGPESFTPDNRYILGETPEVRNLYVMAGFNSVGIQSGGGAGMALAEWMTAGEPTMDLADLDIARFHPAQATKAYLYDRTVESVGLLYAMHWPFRQPETARGGRRSALHDRLAAAGACFGQAVGWERPMWYARAGQPPVYDHAWGRADWFANWADEHRAVRERVGLFDLSSFGKILVSGRDAEAVLQRVCAADIAVAPGRTVYTQWLNGRGGIIADLTVTRIAADRFLVVTAAASLVRDLAWLERQIGDAFAIATDVTGAWSTLAVMGPRARALLSAVADADLSNGAFPFGTSREIEVGYARVRASRISYVGELGWELYVPVESSLHVFERLIGAGKAHGMALAGYHALDSLRSEKGYRHWGHDITPVDTPLEAGLAFAVGWKKTADFIGRRPLEARRGQPLTKRLVHLRLDDPEPLLFHDEPIYRDGERVGAVSSASYGHTLGAAVGMGYLVNAAGVDSAWLADGRYTIDVAGRQIAATVAARPFYDPTSARMKV